MPRVFDEIPGYAHRDAGEGYSRSAQGSNGYWDVNLELC
jgi:hypothetical protein